MAEMWRRLAAWTDPPLRQGTIILVILITAFLYQPLFTGKILTASDILYEIDPLWQPLTPPGFTASANGLLIDQIALFYPWQAYARAAFAEGHFALWDPPLWNSYVNSGHPFLGNLQSALYDPLHLLTFLVPFPQSLGVLAWLRLFVAGFFTLCLALELGLSRRAAYLAMLVFTFGMPQIVWLGYTKASVLAWLPALWFVSARLIRRGDWRDVAWLGFGMMAQLMGGHPEGSIYVGLAWVTFALYGVWYRWRRKQMAVGRTLVQLALGGILGVGLSAVQWLPVLETVFQSATFAARNRVLLDWRSVFFQWDEWVGGITLALPNFFGNARLDTYWYPHGYSNFNEQNFFMGVTTLALALLALFTGHLRSIEHGGSEAASPPSPTPPAPQPDAHPNFWQTPTLWGGPGVYFVWLAIIGIGLALSLPGFPLLAKLPGLHLLAPARWRGIVLLAVALLAAYGLDRYLAALTSRASSDGSGTAQPTATQTLRRWVWIFGTLGIVCALGALAAWLLLNRFYDQILAIGEAQVRNAVANPINHRSYEAYMALAIRRLDILVASMHPTYWPTYLPLWLAILFVGAQVGLMRRAVAAAWRNRVMGGLLLVVIWAELWSVAYDYNPALAPRDVFPTPPLITALRQATAGTSEQPDPFRVVGINQTLSSNVNMIFGLEDVRGYEPSGARRYFELMSRVDGVLPRHPFIIFRHAQSPLLDFLNVRYAFSEVPLAAPWTVVAQAGPATLYANPEALPRAFLVYRAQPVLTLAESLALTTAPDFDPRQQVILEVATQAEAQTMAGIQPPQTPGRSAITHYAPGEIALDVESEAEAILVLSESYISGWQATVDGARVALYPANHAFHAIRVPAGRHSVTFTYAPASVVVGAWVSIGCLVALLALLAGARRVGQEQKRAGK